MNRVVVTGLGPVSSIGIGVSAFGRSLFEGRSGISPITSFDASGFPHFCAGEVRGFRPGTVLRRLDVGSWGRSTIFAAAAARLAVEDADLSLDRISSDRVGVVIGTTCGESALVESLTAQALENGFDGISADLVRKSRGERLAHGVSEELGATGESLTLGTACSASNYALGYAYDQLRHSEADVMIAGGADSVCRWVHAGFFRLGALAKDACSPFDRDRSGILTAEGGAALVLETLDHARARGAEPYSELLGYAVNCDASHMVAPDAASIASCMALAHRNASIAATAVDYICAHGTGTPANDAREFQAIQAVFGETIPPTSSIKSMLGHTMGAASGFGAIASALAIDEGFLPPTINWANPDLNLAGLDPVPNKARRQEVHIAQNNGFAFGGNNAIVILGAFR